MLAQDKEITNPHPHIVLYVDLAAFDWHHLPMAGGYWDQDPVLLESFRIIRRVRAKHDAEQERKRKLNKNMR